MKLPASGTGSLKRRDASLLLNSCLGSHAGVQLRVSFDRRLSHAASQVDLHVVSRLVSSVKKVGLALTDKAEPQRRRSSSSAIGLQRLLLHITFGVEVSLLHRPRTYIYIVIGHL